MPQAASPPKPPDFWHEPLYTTPAGNSSSQDQCRQDTDGNSEHPSKHQVRQAQPSTTGINSEMQEGTNAGLVPDTVGNTGPGGRKKVASGEFHHPVPGHENHTGASSFRMRGHSSRGELLAVPTAHSLVSEQHCLSFGCACTSSVFTMSPPCPLPPFQEATRITLSAAQTGVYQPCYCSAPVQPGLFGGNKRDPFSSFHWMFGLRLPWVSLATGSV